jgi:GNAT superfamily N-acetyltransferase
VKEWQTFSPIVAAGTNDGDARRMARHELWVELADKPGNLAALAGDLCACGASIVHLDVHAGRSDTVIDRLVVQLPDGREPDLQAVAARFRATVRSLGADHPATADAGVGGPARTVVPGGGDGPAVLPDTRAEVPFDVAGTQSARRAPTTLERLVALPDGGLVRLRHLGAADRDELVAHHGRCSEATRRHSRFLDPAAIPHPPAAGDDASDERRRHVALAALIGRDIVGVARFERQGRSLATATVMVEDAHQRRGIGTVLMSELAVLAANADLRCLRAWAPAGGEGLRRTWRRAGLGFSVRRVGDRTVLDCGLPEGLSVTA